MTLIALALPPTSAHLRGLQNYTVSLTNITNITNTNFDSSSSINTIALALCLVFVLLGCFLPTLFHCAPRALAFTEEQAARHVKYWEKTAKEEKSAAKNTAMFKRISSSRLPIGAICAFAGGPLPHTIFSSCQSTLLSMFPRRPDLTIHPEITYAVLERKRQQKLARYATAAATATAVVNASQDALTAFNKQLTAHGGFETDWHRKQAQNADDLDAKNHAEAVRLAKIQDKPPPPDLPKSRCDAAAAAAGDSIHAASKAHALLVAAQLRAADAYAAAQNDFAAAAICKTSCCKVCPSPCCKVPVPDPV
jgi:hypothetical protein